MPTLSLGPFVFSDFEIPEALPLGGAQMLANHKLPGGVRAIDAMGPDDSDITWTGRFRGYTGIARAKFVDTLRIQGQPLPLTFANFRRTVVISSFTYQVERAGLEIPYSITLVVVSNDDAPTSGPPMPSVEQLLAADVAATLALGMQIAEAQVAIAQIQTAYQAYKSAKAGNVMALANLATSLTATAAASATAAGAPQGLQDALLAANQTVNQTVKSTALIVQAAALPSSGASPSASAAAIIEAAGAFGKLSDLMTLGNFITRAAVNNGNTLGTGQTWTGPSVNAASAP